jgi:hypothetical protein
MTSQILVREASILLLLLLRVILAGFQLMQLLIMSRAALYHAEVVHLVVF